MMFGRRKGDFNPRRFWSWFSTEAHGLANGIEALTRGEADAEWLLIGLNERMHRYDPQLSADLSLTLDGRHKLTISGDNTASMLALLQAAPAITGWRFTADEPAADTRRIPFRVAPRPALDKADAFTLRYEAADAYAV